MIDFPNSPSLGQQFLSGGMVWQWDGAKWFAINNAANVVASAIPPANPQVGNLWWDVNGGQLYIWYNDGTSAQWVVANTTAGSPSWQIGPGLALNTGTTPNTLGMASPTPAIPKLGVTDGSNAAAGQVGEVITANMGSAGVNIPASNTWTNVLSITLTPGDWDVVGTINITSSAGATNIAATQSLTTAPSSAMGDFWVQIYGVTLSEFGSAIPPQRYTVTANTIVYLLGFCAFTTGTVTAYGQLIARRMR
jgi:hypothetical protein